MPIGEPITQEKHLIDNKEKNVEDDREHMITSNNGIIETSNEQQRRESTSSSSSSSSSSSDSVSSSEKKEMLDENNMCVDDVSINAENNTSERITENNNDTADTGEISIDSD